MGSVLLTETAGSLVRLVHSAIFRQDVNQVGMMDGPSKS